jgi:hypothetical protein
MPANGCSRFVLTSASPFCMPEMSVVGLRPLNSYPHRGGFFVARKDRRPLQEIARVLGHISAHDIALIIHALTLHRLCGAFALEVRAGKWVVVKVSKAEQPKRTR